ncbi:MAG: hypothetical protein LBQ93_00105 [Treponema sp.]|jgi:hypothetical protein|nr:hypothetical protein [Treponema sp.]
MILGEKSAFVAGHDRSKLSSNVYSFSDVVDETCKKLMDQQIKYSIRRIQEMDERLAGLEKELDNFLLQKNRK